MRPPCGHVTSAHPPFVCMWKDKSGITSLRLCFPQDQLKRSHSGRSWARLLSGGPPKADRKQTTTLRLDLDLLEHFRNA